MGIRMTTRYNRVPQITARVTAGAEALAVATRVAIAEDARANAPVGSSAEGDRHPGELRDSIAVDGDKVVATAPHAGFVENGTVFMRAIPFFRPAVERGRALLRAGVAKLAK